MRFLKTLSLYLAVCLGLALGLAASSTLSSCATSGPTGAAYLPQIATPQVPSGTTIPLLSTFTDGGPGSVGNPQTQLDGGALYSAIFATGAEPVSAVCNVSTGTINSTCAGQLQILCGDDVTSLYPVADAGYQILNTKATIAVGAATTNPTPFAYCQVGFIPNGVGDAGIITDCSAALGR
jgi:hypothetical protein